MAVWVVRAGRNGETEDLGLDQGLVAVNWSEVPDLSTFQEREQLVESCRAHYPSESPNTIANWAGQLWAFRERIQPGELVILPRRRPGASGMLAVGQITGPYRYRPDLPPEAYHTRPVEWLRKDLPRAMLDQDIQFSLGGLSTVFHIKRENTAERIRAAMTGTPSIQSTAAAVTSPGPEIPTDVEAPTDLDTYSRDRIRTYIEQKFRGHAFARLVNAILLAQGYQTLNSPPGPDGGVDIIAGKGPLGFDSPRICVQVKATVAPTDVHPLRELQGALAGFTADQGLFVSWGGFTQPALTFARRHYFALRLWDADSVLDALFDNYNQIAPDVQAELPLKRIWTLVQGE